MFEEIINQSQCAIASGKLLGLPTETVYGLGAPITKIDLVDKVFAIKKRPLTNPLIVHVSSIEMAKRYVERWPQLAQDLCEAFWPGPLTLLVQKSELIDHRITAGSPWVALRMPDHDLTLRIISAFDQGFVAPSANPYQKLSPTSAAMVQAYFSTDDVMVIDGGPCKVGIESTVVQIINDQEIAIARPGMITQDQLQKNLLTSIKIKKASAVTSPSPGQSQKHYQPKAPIVLALTRKLSLEEAREKLLAQHPELLLTHGTTLEIQQDPKQFAQSLYQQLHILSTQADFILICVNDLIQQQPGIIDRLTKAATVIV
ncbi:MAG: L-threonylcarbamoyladenylate synthase [Bdellovibrionota bacterium]